ncbi:hypothetical protein V8J36_09000 [Frigidibacter sp. MR17.14]|uniref:hypothetical protein n=1 Tax=Frigidibacter sp. MR17.14 TaxID=3126509 RepID=UPI003012C7C2
MAEPADRDDPKGLIRESYRIEHIGEAECRSIFLDWALSLPAGTDAGAAMARLLARHGEAEAGHPMSALLAAEAPVAAAAGARRGGAMGRRRRN